MRFVKVVCLVCLRWLSSDKVCLAICTNSAKCTLGLSICHSNPWTPHLSARTGHASSGGACKGWCSSFCLSWLSTLVFQSCEGRGDKGSVTSRVPGSQLQAVTAHTALPLPLSERYLDKVAMESRQGLSSSVRSQQDCGSDCHPNTASLHVVQQNLLRAAYKLL